MKKSVYIFYTILLVCLIGFQQKSFSQTATEEEPYVLATTMPEFPGGSDSMVEFIQDNLNYPDAEKKANIQGTIMMQFIVEKNGTLTHIKAVKSVTGGDNLAKEAERVIKLMPKWKPGMQDGHTVRVYKNVPFYFVLAQRKQPQTQTNHK